jgi:PKD domain-containing protein
MSQQVAVPAQANEIEHAKRSRVRVPAPAVLLALVVGMLSITTGSASAADWLAPKDISAANEEVDGRPEVAVDQAGNAVAIWERHVGGEEIVEATERPAGGDWSEPQVLSLPGEEGQRSQVAIDASGTAIAVWITGESSTDYVVRSAARPPGGEWSEPEDVSDAISEAVTPQLALDAGSEAVAVWTAFDAGDRILQGAVRSANGEWSEPDDLSDAGQFVTPLEAPDAAIDAAGNAIAVWTLEGGNYVVQAAVRPAGGDWEEPDDLSGVGEDAREPVVAMSPAGDAIAAWTHFDSSDIVQAAVRPAGGDWAGADDLSAPGQDAGEPDVAIDETGGAVAAWHRLNGSDFVVQAAVRPAGGDWTGADDLSNAGQDATEPDVAMNVTTGAVAMWRRSDGADLRVQAAVRPAGGTWSGPDDLSAAGENAGFPDLALDAAGNAFAVFGRSGDDGPFVQATDYDLSAPRLDGLRIPATGTVGEPVSFAVSPFDVFPLAATSWTFGDGSQAASGNAVSHVYAAPGAYPVTVSAVDAGGNTSTRVAAIAIAAAKPPPPRRKIALTLRIDKESLRKLRRTGSLRVAASVNEAASVALSGQAKLKVRRARGGTRTRLVPVFVPKTVRFAAETEGKVTLALSERGRKALQSLSQVRLLIAGEARDEGGGTATKTAARTLR